jgi:general L-amino acid transport system permease protein
LTSHPTGDAAWRARERARRVRAFAMQGAFALVLVVLVALLARNVGANLAARQIKSGFDFLHDPAGFNIGEALFDYSARDTYLRAFAVGLANTVRVSLAGIVLASFLGIVVGAMRLATHPLLRALGGAFVEVFRNTPLLIQLLAIYLVVTELLPEASEALTLPGVALLSKEGLQIAVPLRGAEALGWALGVGLVAGVATTLVARRFISAGAGLAGVAAAFVAGALAWLGAGAAMGWSQPVVNGFLLEGGAALTPEFLALWLGLSLFTGAAIAELVRAGALAVPAGQWNAAMGLGLTRGQAMATVIFPQALRLAIPPLASQYMNLIKNSSLAVLIGFPDLVSIANTSINQNGQALEAILIIMLVYLCLNVVVAALMAIVNARVTRAPR